MGSKEMQIFEEKKFRGRREVKGVFVIDVGAVTGSASAFSRSATLIYGGMKRANSLNFEYEPPWDKPHI